MTKQCSRCRTEKPEIEFSNRTEKPHLLRSWCKSCVNKTTADRRRRDPEKHLKMAREAARKRRKEHPEELKRFKGLGKYRFHNARFSAKRKGKEWVLSPKEYFDLIRMSCEYCEGPLNEYGIALDRIDPTLGYVLGNVAPCCTVCNRAKQDYFTYAEMKKLGSLIAEIRQNRRKEAKS